MNGWRIILGTGGALAVWTSVWSAQAQTTSPYTMPVATATQSHDAPPNRADNILAPAEHEDQISEDEIPVTPPPHLNLFEQTPGQEKSWIEMTPEEILGIAPLPKATDAKTPGTSLKSFSHSPLQDLLSERHSSQSYLLQENGSRDGNNGDDPNNPDRLDSTGSRRSETMPRGGLMASPLSSLLENSRLNFSQESSDGELSSLFHARKATEATEATEAHEADMEAFRQMISPSAPDKADNANGGAKMVAVDPDVERASAKYNPNGNSFAPQEDGINRPKRLTALPTATMLNPNLNPSTPPAWAPQPPPWTLKTPQLFVEPQRKF